MKFKYSDTYFLKGMTGWHSASFPTISDELRRRLFKGWTALDFGCGDGFYGATIESGVSHLDGVDYSDSLERNANRKHYRRFWTADLGSPYSNIPKDHYDFLFSSEVIEHVENYRIFLSNAAAVLKPGGGLFLTTTTFSCSLPILMQTKPKTIGIAPVIEFLRGWLGNEQQASRFVIRLWDWTKGHYHGFSKGQLRRALEEAGFDNIKIKYLHVMPVIYTDFFRNPFSNVKLRWLIIVAARLSYFGALMVNCLCRKFDIYAPNLIVTAEKRRG
jgi:2-polyprenyl-3-methyl-5-hydroxy-6-metoxy-1,4-benzoquinol methylase